MPWIIEIGGDSSQGVSHFALWNIANREPRIMWSGAHLFLYSSTGFRSQALFNAQATTVLQNKLPWCGSLDLIVSPPIVIQAERDISFAFREWSAEKASHTMDVEYRQRLCDPRHGTCDN